MSVNNMKEAKKSAIEGIEKCDAFIAFQMVVSEDGLAAANGVGIDMEALGEKIGKLSVNARMSMSADGVLYPTDHISQKVVRAFYLDIAMKALQRSPDALERMMPGGA
jgi:hypothetical protein